jgi:aryl-alcohol dehydrogenase-like predicted oxidoreductase
MWPLHAVQPLIGMGCMRLPTARDRDQTRAIGVLHAAFDAGVTVLDTADAYCWDENDVGHNERLIASALATWRGDRSRVLVTTKGGLTRPQGAWRADGRARHLVSACEASRRALGIERIDLYQLHTPDARTPLSTSVRALAALKRDGLIECIGLGNVNVGQIEEARRITDIAAVQVELSVWHDDNVLSGVAEYCVTNGIRLLAYRPLGGPQRRARTRSDPVLTEVAARHGVTAFEIALAWLRDLSDVIVPIPGPTRVETAASLARTYQIELTDEDRALLDDRFACSRLRASSRAAARRQAGSRDPVTHLPRSPALYGRPYPAFTNITMTTSTGKSAYDGLQFGVNARTRRFTFGGTYTLSRTYDNHNGNRGGTPTNWFNLDDEYTYASSDQRNRFVVNAVTMLPYSVQASAILFVGSPRPINVASNLDPFGLGYTGRWLDATGRTVPRDSERTGCDACFPVTINGVTTLESVSGWDRKLDLRFAKSVKVQHLTLQGMVDVFNALNINNATGYTANYFSRTYLQPSISTNLFYQPRQIQFGFRVSY